jgi:3-dehydroquinate synthase
MKKIKLKIKQKNTIEYPIIIGENISLKQSEVLKNQNYSKILCIFDENLKIERVKKTLGQLNVVKLPIKANDKNKTLEQISKIWKELYANNFDRHSLIINIGGGVVCDIGGFAASTYMRGIPFIQIPTTLLAQVDASIGGKTGINFLGGKNIIGTFQQPIAVIIDIAYLETLPKRELISGYAEVIKHGIISGEEHFKQFTSKKVTQYEKEELINIIEQSCLIKKQIVEADSQENRERKILNLGHTVGHAIESLSHNTDNPLLHGEAVSIGIVAECDIAEQIGLLSHKTSKEIQAMLEKQYLPVKTKDIKEEDIYQLTTKDKKNKNGQIRWVLPKQFGNILYDQVVTEKIIKKAIKQIIYE